MAAAQNGWIDGDKAMMESLVAFRRAGAGGLTPISRGERRRSCAPDEIPPARLTVQL
jgi:hypothetical protein